MRAHLLIVTVLIAAFALPAAAQERVRAWEEEIVIPTYQPYPDEALGRGAAARAAWQAGAGNAPTDVEQIEYIGWSRQALAARM